MDDEKNKLRTDLFALSARVETLERQAAEARVAEARVAEAAKAAKVAKPSIFAKQEKK